MLRDAAISLSLANICFLKVWGKLLSGAGAYFTEFQITYASIVVDVLLLATLLLAAITIVRRSRNNLLMKIARWAFLLAILTAVNSIASLVLTLSTVNFSVVAGTKIN